MNCNCNCNYIFIHQVALARRQRRDLSVFESSCHLPICLPHTMEASHCPFNCRTSSREAVNTNFYGLWFDSTGNRTRVYRFSSRRSIHSTTELCSASKATCVCVLCCEDLHLKLTHISYSVICHMLPILE